MKRERYFDFLFAWDETEKGNEFENKSKEYLAFLEKAYSEISGLSSDNNHSYIQGNLTTLNSAIETIKKFLDDSGTEKDYIAFFLGCQKTYHALYLSSKSLKNIEFFRGQLRAASDIYKGLNYLTQSMLSRNSI
jgi:hypothetical protein